jgi:hypothetical protein
MIAHLLILGALTADPDAAQVSVKLMSFDDPQMELAILNAEGRPEPVTLYAHALSEAITTHCKEGKLTLFRRPKTTDPKEELVPIATSPVPAGATKLIAIVSGSDDQARLNLILDNGGTAAAGTIRFFNLCPKSVGLSMPGERRILPSGQEITLRPQVKPAQYGQAQFFLPGEDGNWLIAGGLRWLQLEDIRSLLFLLPAPGEEGQIKVRGVEERIAAETKQTAPVNPPASGNKKTAISKTLSQR